MLIAALLFTLPVQAWWHCDWAYRFPVSISKPPGPPLTDYQVQVDLNTANVPAEFDWATQGDDLRVIDEDDLTELNFFIEQWDELAQTAIVWVRVPTIPGGGRTVYFYFDAPPGTPNASTPATFTEPGLKFHTRRTTANPVDRATAEAAFDAAGDNVAGYGCDFINDYTGVFNRSVFAPPSRNGDFGLFAEVFFDVSAAEAGTWQFRYGADFGRGGGLYVDGIALDEKWNSDLWWAFNWNNTAETLQGSISLSEGTHSFRILGFEGCCDGGLTAQFQRPGGTWQALSLANIPLSSRKCPVVEPTVNNGAGEAGSCPTLDVTRTTQSFTDPVNVAVNPKSIPGAVILNVVGVSNSGVGAVDSDSFTITEAIPANMALRVADFDGLNAGPVLFTDGTPSSGLTYNFGGLNDAGDDVEFSNNDATSFVYSPTANAAGTDLAVTHVRIRPKSIFLGDTGGGIPSAEFSFKTVVQ